MKAVSGTATERFLSPRIALVVAVSLLLAGLSASPASAAESQRRLDPLLSLVGGCTKPETLDPVVDPGCPETPPVSSHPPNTFAAPTSVATDEYGNMYVSSFGKSLKGTEGRIDIFTADGVFIDQLVPPYGPHAVKVDSEGNLYVIQENYDVEVGQALRNQIAVFEPTVYEPELGNIEYGDPPVVIDESLAAVIGLAINPANDHVFVNLGASGLQEYTAADEGNTLVRTVPLAVWPYGAGVAIDASRERIYVTEEDDVVQIRDLAPPSEIIGTIEGSEVPEGEFLSYIAVTADEDTGHVFVLDGAANRIYEFDEDGEYISTLEHGFQTVTGAQISIDNGAFSPNGALSTKGRYLFVASHKSGTGHSFAFEEAKEAAPDVKELTSLGSTENEAELQATINPHNLATSYIFEYTTLKRFKKEEFTGAAVARTGQLPVENLDIDVSASIGSLEPGTSYRFRVSATNELGSDQEEGEFATYPAIPFEPSPCGNFLFRIGLSSSLPDCRAYELVTPADTNGRAPVGASHLGYWTTRQVAPAGDKLPFRVEGGSLPGSDATGSYLGDPYLSSRGPGGWTTTLTGPNGGEATDVEPGGSSPDQGYLLWTASGAGSKVLEEKLTAYVRYPDGHSELLGEGSIATEPQVNGLLISEGGEHQIFTTGAIGTPVQLEPDAAPTGTKTIYDRSLDGDLRVVSLLPGDIPLGAGENAIYQNASLDGKGVAFEVGTTLYLRYDNSETFEIGAGVAFAGVAEGGNQIFYVDGGKLLRFDALTEDVTEFNAAGSVTPVMISPDGSAAYFVSTAVLTTTPNPENVKAKNGKENLYLSREGTISFVGTVTDRDVDGTAGPTEQVDGLGLWTSAVGPPTPGRLSNVPARTTPDGSVLLFQSRAPLTGFESGEHSQVYRYDSIGDELKCISCNPVAAAATGDATLQSARRGTFALFFPTAWIDNIRADGRRAVFQSTEALIPGDTDGLQDVYEWEDQGVGSCTLPDGCLYLISSGHSVRDDYLWAVSKSGDDVFFLSSDLLLPADADETVSIYDARVGGGFADPVGAGDCQGEGCRPDLAAPPNMPTANTPVTGAGDNFKPRQCPKGKRKVKRAGKVKCVKKQHRRKAGTKGKGAGK